MNDPLEMARGVLAQQAFSVFLGAELVAFAPEKTELRLPVRAEFRQQHGFVHGGLLSYLVDNALTFAGGAALGPMLLTSEFKINYVRPASGTLLIARARVIHTGRRQAVCSCEIFDVNDGDEALCAVAQGTIVKTAKSET